MAVRLKDLQAGPNYRVAALLKTTRAHLGNNEYHFVTNRLKDVQTGPHYGVASILKTNKAHLRHGEFFQ